MLNYAVNFQETIEACEVKVGTYGQINKYMTIYDNPRSRWSIEVINRPLSKVTQIQHFQNSFPKKTLGHLKPNITWSLHVMSG